MITPRSWLCHFQILMTSCVMLCDTGIKPYWMARMPMSRSMLWEHVLHTLFNTPDGTNGEPYNATRWLQCACNIPDLDEPHFVLESSWMYIYLADIIIYTDTVDEHWVKHIWKVFEILCYEKLFLSLARMQFFCQWWPTYPGSYHQGTGYNHGSTQGHYNSELEGPNKQKPSGELHWCCRIKLANDCKGILIPMGVLTSEIYNTQKLWTQDQLIVWHIWHQLIV